MSKVERHLYRIGALHCVAESCFGCRRVSSPLRNKHHVGLKRNALELMLLLLLVLCKLRQRNYIRYTHKRTHETNEYVHTYSYKHSTAQRTTTKQKRCQYTDFFLLYEINVHLRLAKHFTVCMCIAILLTCKFEL